jgi:hypothetical protein
VMVDSEGPEELSLLLVALCCHLQNTRTFFIRSRRANLRSFTQDHQNVPAASH